MIIKNAATSKAVQPVVANTSDLTSSIQAMREHFPNMHHLCVSDVSDGHTATTEALQSSRSLNAKGREYLLMVVTPEFEGMKTLARHRQVQSFFQQGFDTGAIHSIQLRTWTVPQWENKGSPQSVRDDVPCCLDNDPAVVAQRHPIGTTQRIEFRWWNENNESDLRLATKVWGNAQVTAMIGGPFNEMQVMDRLAKECKRRAVEGFQYWPLFSRTTTGATTGATTGDQNDNFIGVCGLQRYTGETAQSRGLMNVVEVGFHLLPHCWRQGFASEAATQVLKYAFDTLHVDAVYAGHHPSNTASGCAIRKLGELLSQITILFYILKYACVTIGKY